jgi:renalase
MAPSPEKRTVSVDDHVPHRVAVVGAGLTGMSCARALERMGCTTTVFDRGRRPGGRISTRHIESDGTTLSFDLGAPSFDRPEGEFGIEVDRWLEHGAASIWTPTEARWSEGMLKESPEARTRITGLPAMDAIPDHLAEGLSIQVSMTVRGLHRLDGSWILTVTPWREDEREIGPFDSVVLAMAAPQSARLLAGTAPELAKSLERIRMSTTWVALLEVDDAGDDLPEILHVPEETVLTKLIRESGRPGRTVTPGRTSWVVHADDTWSSEHHDTERTEIAATLEQQARDVLEKITGRSIQATRKAVAHRWGMARSIETLKERCLRDDALRLAVCGDGIGGSDIEACHLGGLAAADCIDSWARPAK